MRFGSRIIFSVWQFVFLKESVLNIECLGNDFLGSAEILQRAERYGKCLSVHKFALEGEKDEGCIVDSLPCSSLNFNLFDIFIWFGQRCSTNTFLDIARAANNLLLSARSISLFGFKVAMCQGHFHLLSSY